MRVFCPCQFGNVKNQNCMTSRHPPMDALITLGCFSTAGPVGTPPLVGDLPPGPGGAPHADAI